MQTASFQGAGRAVRSRPALLDPSSAPELPTRPTVSGPAPATERQSADRGRSIQSVDRVLSIIEVLSISDGPCMLRDLCAMSGLNLSTCHHLVNTLVRRGYVIYAGRAKGYSLSSKFEMLSCRSGRDANLVQFIMPSLRELNESIREAVQFSVLRSTALMNYARLPALYHSRSESNDVTVRHAVHAVATGKAILAWLPESELARVVGDNGLADLTPRTITRLSALIDDLRMVRRRGHAIDDGESRIDIYGVSAPVRDLSGAIVGAIGVNIPAKRATEAYRGYITRAVEACARDLSARTPAGSFV